MTPRFPGAGWLVLPLLAVLLWLGIWLVRTGLRRNRGRGTAPHCARCGYNLTALTSARCPECGADVTPENTIRGEPQRAPLLIGAGLVCLLMWLAAVIPLAISFNWYSLKPTAWVISDLEGNRSRKAWRELDGRIKARNVSAAQVSRIIDVGLRVQINAAQRGVADELMTLLATCLLNGSMSTAQSQRFLDQTVVLSLAVRPKVIDGNFVPYTLSHGSRGCKDLWVEVGKQETYVDGQLIQGPRGGSSCFSGTNGGGSFSSRVPCRGLGAHMLEVRSRVRIYAGTSLDPVVSTLLREAQVPVQATFEIVADAPEYRVQLKKGAVTPAAVQHSIKPIDFFMGGSSGHRWFNGTFKISEAPANIAFEVFARIEGREFKFGTLHTLAGDSRQYGMSAQETMPVADRCDIILRSSVQAAENTEELREIWDGELVYKDVPINIGTLATQPASGAAP